MKKHLMLLFLGFFVILLGITSLFVVNSDENLIFLSTIFLSLGIFLSVVSILFKDFFDSGELLYDERTEKISNMATGRSWFLTFITANILLILNINGDIISCCQGLTTIVCVMIFTHLIATFYYRNKKN